jgi:ribosomal protein S18 acetylase RimI-like enzyme
MSINDLKQLAVDSGIYSRFIVDPIFPNEKAIAMFEEWIVRSVAKSIADDVLVIADGSRIAGMATIVNKGTYASIGLVAVAEGYRGRQYGEALVRSTQSWCGERGIEQIQVTTQNANVPARRLYQKCHFDLKTIEHFYHFWNRDLPLTNEFSRRRAVA